MERERAPEKEWFWRTRAGRIWMLCAIVAPITYASVKASGAIAAREAARAEAVRDAKLVLQLRGIGGLDEEWRTSQATMLVDLQDRGVPLGEAIAALEAREFVEYARRRESGR